MVSVQMVSAQEVTEKAARVKLLLTDVDGVLTDGRLFTFPGPDGSMVEFKAFDSQDGIALQWMASKGYRTGVISGRNSPSTVERARQCKMTYVYQGHTEKIPIFEEIMADAKIGPDEVCYVGDDLTDVVLFRRVGLAVAPQNARKEVKAKAHYVTAAEGGRGAVREVIELILQARGEWGDVLRKYEAD